MSTSTPPHECNTEHEILGYIRTQKHINKLTADSAMPMKLSTPLTKAIDALSCIPFVQTSVWVSKDEKSFTIANVEAGTVYNPKVDVILEKSTPSSFGKGSETVLDPSYRSGREIQAKDIGLQDIGREMLDDVGNVMFPGRKLDLKLYKLAVYETGGHFDWHMDSTHSDKHHATLLVALNTSWEGGDLVLRRNGIETPMDLRPKDPYSGWTNLQGVAFFTDTEHRVEPVKSGIRIVLQYDIEVEKDEDEEKGEDEEEDEDEENEKEWMKRIRASSPYHVETDKAALDKVLTIIKELHSDGIREVACALQHLYRKASISANYLKGSDAILHDALIASGEFDVSLHPVVFHESSDEYGGEGGISEHYVYRYDAVKLDLLNNDEHNEHRPPPRKRKKLDKIPFHIPKFSAAQEISRQEFIEYTGNEALPAEYRYFGGGIFIRPKAK